MTESLSDPLLISPGTFVVVLVAILIAAATDVWKFKVYNLVTLPVLFSGLVYHTIDKGIPGLTESMLGAIFGFGALILLFFMGGMGGGDVKLAAGIGAWLGWGPTSMILLASCLVTGIYALVLVVRYQRVQETLQNLELIWRRLVIITRHLGADDEIEEKVNLPDCRQRLIPFSMMILMGTMGLLVISLVKRYWV